MADRGALDAAITALGNETSNLITLAQSLIARGQQSTGIDYSTEIDQLNQIGTNISSAIASAATAAATPDVPQGVPPSSTTSAASTVTGTGNTGLGSLSTTGASNGAILPPTTEGQQEAAGTPAHG